MLYQVQEPYKNLFSSVRAYLYNMEFSLVNDRDMHAISSPYIEGVSQQVTCLLHNVGKNLRILDEPKIVDSITRSYMVDALPVVLRAQIELQQSFMENEDNGAEFWKWIKNAEAQSVVKEKYPELVRILNVKQQDIVSLVENSLQRFVRDRDELVSRGFPVDGGLLDLVISAGDAHQGGQKVCFIETDTGKVVYKPRSMRVDSVVSQIAGIVNRELTNCNFIKIPKVMDRGCYGWQEFIEYKPAKTLTELSAYYQSLGSLTAFFAALGGQDFHYENVVTVSRKAVPLDLEAALGSSYSISEVDNLTGISKFVKNIMRSAGVDTLILPSVARGKRFDIDLSPITDGFPQESEIMRSLNIRIEDDGDIKISMENSKITKQNPYEGDLLGDDAHPRRYVKEFTQGFQEMSHIIECCADKLYDFFRNASHIPNRCIIRPTSTYTAFLETSYHPKYLVSQKARDELFTLLGYPPGAPDNIGDQALESERKALLNGDIPYFTDDTLTEFMENSPKKNIAGDTSLEEFRVAPDRALKNFLSGIKSRDSIRYLHYGFFAGIDADVWRTRKHEEMAPFFHIALDGDWGESLYGLCKQMQDLVIADESCNTATMFIQVPADDNRISVIPLDASYYEGQGILWLFHEVFCENGDPDYVVLITAMLRALVDPPKYISEELISGFVGSFSQIRLVPLVHKYLGDEIAKNLMTTLIKWACERMDKPNESGNLKVDYVTGLSGALTALGMLEGSSDSEVYFLRDRMHAVVINSLVKGELEDTYGIAHGPLGLMLGLVLGGRPLTDVEQQKLRTLVRQRVEKELKRVETQNAVSKHAWCSGISGIVEAFAHVLNATGGLEEQDYKQLVELYGQFQRDIASLNGPTDISLCHGLGGALAAWYRIACLLPELNLAEKVRGEAAQLRQQLSEGTLEIRGGVRHATSSLGMMLGMSGVVLALNRIESGREFTCFLSF